MRPSRFSTPVQEQGFDAIAEQLPPNLQMQITAHAQGIAKVRAGGGGGGGGRGGTEGRVVETFRICMQGTANANSAPPINHLLWPFAR